MQRNSTIGELMERKRIQDGAKEYQGHTYMDLARLPTGITQNVKDLLRSPEIANILENSDFIYMLNQASDDRSILAQRLNISPHQLSYVTNSGEGEGLLFYGNVILPFIDRFPTDLELYRIMTTKLNEVAQEKEA